MPNKPCICCGVVKGLAEYYTHRKMADGHLNKCKECVKAYQSVRKRILQGDAGWVRKERARGREKMRRVGPGNIDPEKRAQALRRYNERARESGKYWARNQLANAVRDGRKKKPKRCQVCRKEPKPKNLHGHHDDYSKPLKVRWLCASCHGKHHRINQDGLEYRPVAPFKPAHQKYTGKAAKP